MEFIAISDAPMFILFLSPQVSKEKGTHFTKIKQTSIVLSRAVQTFPFSLLQMKAVLILLSQFKLV
jgi:hypothetical protein